MSVVSKLTLTRETRQDYSAAQFKLFVYSFKLPRLSRARALVAVLVTDARRLSVSVYISYYILGAAGSVIAREMMMKLFNSDKGTSEEEAAANACDKQGVTEKLGQLFPGR